MYNVSFIKIFYYKSNVSRSKLGSLEDLDLFLCSFLVNVNEFLDVLEQKLTR